MDTEAAALLQNNEASGGKGLGSVILLSGIWFKEFTFRDLYWLT